MRARVDVPGFREARTQIGAMGDRARNPRLVLGSDRMRDEFEQAAARRWSKVRPMNKPKWRRYKAAHGLSTDVMKATGDSYDAVVNDSGPRRGGVEFRADNNEVRFGAKRGRSDLYPLVINEKAHGSHPKRRVVSIDKPFRINAATLITRFVADGRIT